jgi:hypothetical protein
LIPEWRDYAYLASGTPRQQAAYEVLNGLRLAAVLRAYTPVLVGTIPLGVDVDDSDLDILCEAHDTNAFARRLKRAFHHHPDFALKKTEVDDLPTVIARFTSGEFVVEVFGQSRPVHEQQAFRHLQVEARLLALGGPSSADAVRELKRQGVKTEPAFAQVFKLEGDPYRALLLLADLDDKALRAALKRAKK